MNSKTINTYPGLGMRAVFLYWSYRSLEIGCFCKITSEAGKLQLIYRPLKGMGCVI